MQPLAAAFIAAAAVALVVSASIWLVMHNLRNNAAVELSAFLAANKMPPLEAAATPRGDVELPVFSSASLTADFHAVAADVKLPVDEVSYTLDNGAHQPFLRYRVALTVKTGYPEVRKFVAALTAALPNVALDNVRCVKEASAVLSCQLGFSAFYKKGGHG
jgi:hypothetical protein